MRRCFFVKVTATPGIYTLSLHDALPIPITCGWPLLLVNWPSHNPRAIVNRRSEEHTSELQSRGQLVCRLLLDKKKHWVLWVIGVAVAGMTAFYMFRVLFMTFFGQSRADP